MKVREFGGIQNTHRALLEAEGERATINHECLFTEESLRRQVPDAAICGARGWVSELVVPGVFGESHSVVIGLSFTSEALDAAEEVTQP